MSQAVPGSTGMTSDPNDGLEQEFTLDAAGDLVSPPAARVPASDLAAPALGAPTPVVVVHYQARPWWSTVLPAVALALLACAGLTYRVWAPDWFGWDPWAPFRPPAAAPAAASSAEGVALAPPEPTHRGAPVPEPGPPPAPTQATIDVSPNPTPTPEIAAAPTPDIPPAAATPSVNDNPNEAAKLQVTIRSPAADRILRPGPPAREAQAAENVSQADPPAAAEAPEENAPAAAGGAMADIVREAQARHAERAELEGMKAELLDEQTLADRARDYQARRAYQLELRKVLQQVGHLDDAIVAGRIHALPDDSGEPGVKDRHAADSGVIPGARNDSIRSLRRAGVAEREILRRLEEGHLRNRVARNGPRSEAEATIRAGRDLVTVSLDPVPTASPAANANANAAGAAAKGSSRPMKYPISSRRQ